MLKRSKDQSTEAKVYTVEDFTKEYQVLCNKTGFRINGTEVTLLAI